MYELFDAPQAAIAELTPELFQSLQPLTYQQRAVKEVQLVWNTSTEHYELSWGEQFFSGPHIRVIGIDGKPVSHYGVALNEFFSTHEPYMDIGETKMLFRKTAKVLAVQAPYPINVITKTEDGNVEAVAQVPAGGYIIKNPGKDDYYTNTPEKFNTSYVLV